LQVRLAILAACSFAAISAVARADAFVCKPTETQAECHDRLKCKPNEELEDCQKRLRASQQNANGGNTEHRDSGDRDRTESDNGRRNNDSRDGGDQNERGRRNNDSRDGGDQNERSGRDRGGDDGGGSERRGGRRGRGSRSSFVANKKFGLGLELGEPDGLNGKYFVTPSNAIDFGVGYIYDHYYYGDGLHLYGDYLWHFSVASTPAFELPFYIGPGLRFWRFDYCVQNVCTYGGQAVGIRMPLGLAFDFNNAPIDIFLQVVPTLDFLSGDYYARYGDRVHFGIDGSVGIRFWFN